MWIITPPSTLREYFGKNIAPLVVPYLGRKQTGHRNRGRASQAAYEIRDGKRTEIPVPEDKVSVVDEIYGQLMESVAETSEEFMDKFFSGEDFTYAR